jgi:hypothetical protein
MLAIARQVNWPDTLEMLIRSPGAWPSRDDFKPESMTAALENWRAGGNKVEGGAYRIRAENNKSKPWYRWTKQRYVSEIVLGRLWRYRHQFVRLFDTKPTMARVWREFRNEYYVGWGPFTAGQVTTDLRHTRYLCDTPDKASWAAVGPGSQSGLNRLHGRGADYKTDQAHIDQDAALREMREVQRLLPKYLEPWVPKDIELTDIQNCLCDGAHKYLSALAGTGKPKVKYIVGRRW